MKWTSIAEVHSEDKFGEGESLKGNLDDTHRIIDLLGENNVLIEEDTSENDVAGWEPIATVTREPIGDVATHLAAHLTGDYRVVYDYCASEYRIEREVNADE